MPGGPFGERRFGAFERYELLRAHRDRSRRTMAVEWASLVEHKTNPLSRRFAASVNPVSPDKPRSRSPRRPR